MECGNALLHGAPKLDEKGNPLKDKKGRVIRDTYAAYRKAEYSRKFFEAHREKLH